MMPESQNKVQENYKHIMVSRKKKKYDDRQMLSLSILSLLPDKLSKQISAKHCKHIQSLSKKQFDCIYETIQASPQRRTLKNTFLHKKSSQKQRKIFNKLKINNFSGIRKVSHIIFKSQIDQIIQKMEKKTMKNNHFLPLGQAKMALGHKSPFKISDSCRISHMNLNKEPRYAKMDKTHNESGRSNSVQHPKGKPVLFTTSTHSNFKSFRQRAQERQEIEGWQYQEYPKRCMTNYENTDFETLY